jgi:hypothetical protein
MSATTTTHRPATASSQRWTIAAVSGIAVATVLTALGTFKDPDDHAWRQMIVTEGIVLVTAAIAFWFALRARRGEDRALIRTTVVLGVLALLSVVVFWAGTPAVLGAAATALALEARDRRGALGRGPATAVALSAIAVVLAGVAAVIG